MIRMACHLLDGTEPAASDLPALGGRLEGLLRDARDAESLGYANMVWKQGESPLAPALLDLDAVLALPTYPLILQALPPQVLWSALQHKGFEDSLEVIECLRGTQLAHILDLDIWSRRADDGEWDVTPEGAHRWLSLWSEISPEFAAQRVMEMDEEEVTLFLGALVKVHPEGMTKVPEHELEDMLKTPDGRFFLELPQGVALEGEDHLKGFVVALYGLNPHYASSLFGFVTMLSREETLEQVRVFREGRLADMGFVSRADALAALGPVPMAVLQADFQKTLKIECDRQEAQRILREKNQRTFEKIGDIEADLWLHEGFEQQSRQILKEMDPENAAWLMGQLVGKDEILELVGPGLPPEHLVEDEDLIETVVERVAHQTRALLAAQELVAWREFVSQDTQRPALLVEKAFEVLSEVDGARIFEFKTRLARSCQLVRAGFSAQPYQDRSHRDLLLVRGAINLALESIVSNPETYASLGLQGQEADLAQRAARVIEAMGPEALFKWGWNGLLEGQKKLSEWLLMQNNPELEDILPLILSDGSAQPTTLKTAIREGRWADVRAYLSTREGHWPVEKWLLARALWNRIPVFPVALESATVNRADLDVRPFETQAEWDRFERAWKGSWLAAPAKEGV